MIAIPAPAAEIVLSMQDGAPVSLRRHGNPSGPRMLLNHGNGLASDLYFPLWSRLIEQFDLFLYDLRNHGRNPVGYLGGHDVPHFVSDLGNVVSAIGARYGRKPLIGLFHSLSAAVALLCQQRASLFAALVLFDPPHMPPGAGRRLPVQSQ